MATPRRFIIGGRTVNADELIQIVTDGIEEEVDERVNETTNRLVSEIEDFISEMISATASPRIGAANRMGGDIDARSPYEGLRAQVTYSTRKVLRGRYAGKVVTEALIEVVDENGSLLNAFNAMDTGIPSRRVKTFISFPRYEGNHISRSGSLYPVNNVDITGWVTLSPNPQHRNYRTEINESFPFNILKRIRAMVRNEIKQQGTDKGFIDLSKITIKISGSDNGE